MERKTIDPETMGYEIGCVADAFGQENVQRLTHKERSLLMADVWSVARESEEYGYAGAARELARRVGRDNLVSYAECLTAQHARAEGAK